MRQTAIALGTFDGLHLGHKAVLEKILKSGVKPIALTFELPPKVILNNETSKLLLTPSAKINMLKSMGIQPIVLDFLNVKNLSEKDFLDTIIKNYNPKIIASGFNYRFGKNGDGTAETLTNFCLENKMEYFKLEPVLFEGKSISSTRIRKAVEDGDPYVAARMLGRFFSFNGKVLHGDARGRTLGFPTINQIYPSQLVVPKYGVYATITVIDGKKYKSVTNIGRRPTFETSEVTAETNIFDCNCDLYEKDIEIMLVDFIRDEKKFTSVNELKNAVDESKTKALKILKNYAV